MSASWSKLPDGHLCLSSTHSVSLQRLGMDCSRICIPRICSNSGDNFTGNLHLWWFHACTSFTIFAPLIFITN